MRLDKVIGGHNDDFGRGLYLTTHVKAAETYARMDIEHGRKDAQRGEIFPYVMRGRDLGVVVDVSPGGPHRAAWEAFVVANINAYIGDKVRLRPMPADLSEWLKPQPFGTFDASGNRGEVFERFLIHLAETSNEPHLARPDYVLGELGGPMTSGWGRGDQQAARTQGAMDPLNSQLGFRRATPMPEHPEGPIVARTVDEPSAEDAAKAGKPTDQQPTAEVPPAKTLPADPETPPAPPPKPTPLIPEPETLPHFGRAIDLALTPTLRELEGLVGRVVEKHKVLTEAEITAYVRDPDPAARALRRQAIVAQLAAQKNPKIPGKEVLAARYALEKLEDSLLGYLNTPIREAIARLPEIAPSVVASYILESNVDARTVARQAIADKLEAQGLPKKRIQGILRELGALEKRIGGPTRAIADLLHAGELADPTAAAVPANMQRAVAHSPALAVLAARDPQLFAAIAAKYFKKFNVAEAGADAETFFFQKLKDQSELKSPKNAGRAANAASLLAAMEPMRGLEIGDFRSGLTAAVAHLRGPQDVTGSPFDNRVDTDFESRKPLGKDDAIVPGMRVDNSVSGRGTVMKVDGDVIRILLDAPGAGEVEVSLSALNTFAARNLSGERDPQVVPLRDKDHQDSAQKDIDRYRREESLPAYVEATEAGTVSIARAAGAEGVGTNSTLAARTVNLTHQERTDLLGLLKALGLDPNATTNDPRFVHHAEIASLIELRGELRKAGKPMPEVVELFVDRATCESCGPNLSLVAAYLGIPELRIYTRGQAAGSPPLIIRAR